jgi:hypothetical protein
VVCRNWLGLVFFGLDHGIDALEEPVENLLQSGARALLLRGFDETFAELLQLFVSHCTSTSCNKDTPARSFLSCLQATFFLLGCPSNELIYDDMQGSLPAWSRVAERWSVCCMGNFAHSPPDRGGIRPTAAARKAMTEAWFRYFWYLGRR